MVVETKMLAVAEALQELTKKMAGKADVSRLQVATAGDRASRGAPSRLARGSASAHRPLCF